MGNREKGGVFSSTTRGGVVERGKIGRLRPASMRGKLCLGKHRVPAGHLMENGRT